MLDVERELARAVQYFWKTRAGQHQRQGERTGLKDAGNRSAVTGGKHADGFVNMIAAIVKSAGLEDICIKKAAKRERTLPGYYRPSKEWDLVILSKDELIGAVEVKSQVGSFGNNFNNRVEEALGNATDFWAAYERGFYKPSARPWLGYIFMLEDSPKSRADTKHVQLAPFDIDPQFQTRSYARRYELVCERLVRERLYDAACFIVSESKSGEKGKYEEPNPELSIRNFAAAHAKLSKR
jgi:hypothetical protein